MTHTQNTPSWVRVGAITRESGQHGIGDLRIITRITAAWIFLDNGNRYRTSDLGLVGEKISSYGKSMGWATRLMSGEETIRDAAAEPVRKIYRNVMDDVRAGADPFDATQARLEAALAQLALARKEFEDVQARAAEIVNT